MGNACLRAALRCCAAFEARLSAPYASSRFTLTVLAALPFRSVAAKVRAFRGQNEMTKAIDHIVAGYVTLKNRVALEEIRDHRRRLLNDSRMRGTGPLRFDYIHGDLQAEINAVEAGLEQLNDVSST
jgi:hypothetical protein